DSKRAFFASREGRARNSRPSRGTSSSLRQDSGIAALSLDRKKLGRIFDPRRWISAVPDWRLNSSGVAPASLKAAYRALLERAGSREPADRRVCKAWAAFVRLGRAFPSTCY